MDEKSNDNNVENGLKPQTNSAGIIILQWLTYAFWGWLILGLVWLMSVILINSVLGDSVSGVVPYAIAASVVLLPIAFVCDLFYRKKEPIKKTGGATIIMVIHAVLFAVLGIISLIVAVFTGLNAAINSTGNIESQMVAMMTALFATVLYAAVFTRTLNPFKGKSLSLIYSISMLSLTALLLILAIAGPVVQSVSTRGDRLIEQNLYGVQTAISNYVTDNEELPNSLSDLSLKSGAKELVDNNAVRYIKEGPVVLSDEADQTETAYRYQLCVEFQKEKDNEYDYYQSAKTSDYDDYMSLSSHGAGEECYKLQKVIFDYKN